jgi:Spy/CpxP family protein refolding chaperone
MARKTLWVLILTAATVIAAQAQSAADYPLFLLGQSSVQKELKLGVATVAKLKKIEKEASARYLAMIQPTSGKPDQIRQPDPVALRKERAKTDSAKLALLSSTQKKRLLEIGYQYNGAFSFAQPSVAKRLGLSATQKTRLETAANSAISGYRKAIAPIVKPGSIVSKGRGDRKSTIQKLVAAKLAMMKSMNGAADKILTPTQRAKWKQMKGKPFNVASLFKPNA